MTVRERVSTPPSTYGKWLLAAFAVTALVLAGYGLMRGTGDARSADPVDATAFAPGRSPGEHVPLGAKKVASQASGRPKSAPVPGVDEPFALPDPEPPPHLAELRRRLLREAREQAVPRPGERALRQAAQAFVEHNRELSQAQAEREGLSVREVEELTYFGFLAQHSQRWAEVEELKGQPIDAETRAEADELMRETNREFKAAMRELVRNGATEEERWALIHATQARYKERYFALTGMNETLLDDLLAGDWTRKNPPGTAVPLESQRKSEPESAEPPSATTPQRPRLAPALE